MADSCRQFAGCVLARVAGGSGTRRPVGHVEGRQDLDPDQGYGKKGQPKQGAQHHSPATTHCFFFRKDTSAA
jgi:hypothetical protein